MAYFRPSGVQTLENLEKSGDQQNQIEAAHAPKQKKATKPQEPPPEVWGLSYERNRHFILPARRGHSQEGARGFYDDDF